MSTPPTANGLRLESFLVCALVAFAGWAYFQNARSNGPLHSREPSGYYGFLTDAFVSGQVNLKIIPDPKLLRLADRYAGPQGASRPHDMSFYQGKFYLYYGVTPALILMVPWHVLTGGHLTESAVSTAFCYAGLILCVLWLFQLRRRLFPGVAAGWFILCVAVLGFGSPLFFSSVNPTFYPVPISAAFFCLTVAGLLVDRCLRPAGTVRALLPLACVSLALGLCVGARPNYLLCLPLIVLPAVCLWLATGAAHRSARLLWRIIGAAVVPAALIGLGLAIYNYARFGNPLEFGIQYSLASASVREINLTGFEYYPKNLQLYLLHSAEFIRYFPFVHTGGRPFGLLPHFTLACAALLLPLTWFSARLRREPRWLFGGLFWFGAGMANLAVLCLFFGGEYRYLVDFAPSALLIAAALMLAVLQATRHGSWWLRLAVRGPITLVALWTLLNGVFLTLADRTPDRVIESIARTTNGFAATLEQAFGNSQHGPIELRVRFPKDRTGQREPLLTTGSLVGTGDIVYAIYTDPGHIQFGFFHLGAGGPVSEPVPIDYARTFTLRVDLGSLYPPREHPLFRQWSDTEVSRLRRFLSISLDGTPVFQAAVDVYLSTPAGVKIGANSLAPDVAEARFSGNIESSLRLPVLRLQSRTVDQSGPVRLTLRLPPIRGGDPVPLISTGRPGAGDLLSLQVLGDGRVRFAHDSWGGQSFTSSPVTVKSGSIHTVTAELGSLYPEGATDVSPAQRSRLALWFDDQPVMDLDRPFNPASADSVEFGFNAIGGSGVGKMFTGSLIKIERVPSRPPAVSTVGDSWGPVALELRFPRDARGLAEPVLCTGVFGAADIVFVEYLDDRRVRFGHDHWGTGVIFSEPVVVDYAASHRMVLDLGSLHRRDGTIPAPDRFRITLNGVAVLDARRTTHPSRPDQVAIGRNDVGATTCRPAFSGEITATHRLAP